MLAKLENLSGLALDNCGITDAGVAGLATARRRRVQVGDLTGSGLEVLDGLEAGERHPTVLWPHGGPQAQHDYAVEKIARLNLSERVTVELKDYNTLDGAYDKIASIGENISIRRFARFQLGEGLEAKKEDFASEVAADDAKGQEKRVDDLKLWGSWSLYFLATYLGCVLVMTAPFRRRG